MAIGEEEGSDPFKKSAIPGGASKINSPSGMRVKMQQLLPSERPERQLETLRQPEFGLNPLLVAHERQQIVIAAGWRP